MQLLNFQLAGDGISLNWQGYSLDLHNDYDFQEVRYELLARQVILTWRRSAEYWATGAALPGFELVLTGVTCFLVKERHANAPAADDFCLASLSFYPANLRQDFDNIWLEPVMHFEGCFQRVGAVSVASASCW